MQTKKIYTVTVEFDYVIVARDQNDALRVAHRTAKEALSDQNFADVYFLVQEGMHAEGWDERAYPYGDPFQYTIGDYLKGKV